MFSAVTFPSLKHSELFERYLVAIFSLILKQPTRYQKSTLHCFQELCIHKYKAREETDMHIAGAANNKEFDCK